LIPSIGSVTDIILPIKWFGGTEYNPLGNKMRKKEKMVSITFTVPEKLFGRMEQLRAKEKKSRSIFCRELMGAMVGAVEEWDKKEKKG